jgi:hypothetical protein
MYRYLHTMLEKSYFNGHFVRISQKLDALFATQEKQPYSRVVIVQFLYR